MRHFVALSVFVLAASLTAQIEHAPTVAQCQADYKLWSHAPDLQVYISGLSYSELYARERVLIQCTVIEQDRFWKGNYQVAGFSYAREVQLRLADYLKRKGLDQDFLKEDAAGQR